MPDLLRFFPLLVALLVAGASSAATQESEPPPVPAKKPGLRITFLPPPMEGTLSLGIYDKAGKLVRVLHRDATEKDFTVGLNGLITHWDGKNDLGEVVASGRISARGYAVGALPVEGVAMHGNDFVTAEESLPRLAKIQQLGIDAEDRLRILGKTPEGKEWEWRCDEKGVLTPVRENLPPSDWRDRNSRGEEAITHRGKIYPHGEDAPPLDLPGIGSAIDASYGRADSLWVIDRVDNAVEVKQFSASGEFLRRLAAESPELPPDQVVAARRSDTLYLLDESVPRKIRRLRALTHVETSPPADSAAPATSTWKVLFEKKFWHSDKFADVADRLTGEKPFALEEKISVRLLPNELSTSASKDLEVQIAADAKGAYLRAADGLPLRRLTATPHLKWVVMGRRGGKVVTIFQSDGAVVEEFRARNLASMMAFDAGDYDWAPAK